MDCVIKSRRCVRKEGKKVQRRSIYIGNLVARSTGTQGRNCRRCGYRYGYCGYREHCGYCRSDAANIAVEIGRRVQGVTGVSRDSSTPA